jgi:hypothetical protein
VLKKAAAGKLNKSDKPVAIVSYDERPVARQATDRPLRVHLHAKHGSWLNLVEGFFSKFARSVLRHIRVTSKYELKQRIMAGIDDFTRYPVIHTWSYKLAEAA